MRSSRATRAACSSWSSGPRRRALQEVSEPVARLIIENWQRPPPARRYMPRAFLWRRSRAAPFEAAGEILERWDPVLVSGRDGAWQQTRAALGDEQGDNDDEDDRTGLGAILYPHVFGYRLQMALLTHPRFPRPIWNALQIRNRFTQHGAWWTHRTLRLETRATQHRYLARGVELDLTTTMRVGDQCLWESVVTYWYRGGSRAPDAAMTTATSSQATTATPEVERPNLDDASTAATLQLPADGGWRFARLTGDYNGIHWLKPYARAFGYAAPFLHSQRAVAACLRELRRARRSDASAQRLDLWLKGPVFYGDAATLHSVTCEGAIDFGLFVPKDERPAIVGRWVQGPA